MFLTGISLDRVGFGSSGCDRYRVAKIQDHEIVVDDLDVFKGDGSINLDSDAQDSESEIFSFLQM